MNNFLTVTSIDKHGSPSDLSTVNLTSFHSAPSKNNSTTYRLKLPSSSIFAPNTIHYCSIEYNHPKLKITLDSITVIEISENLKNRFNDIELIYVGFEGNSLNITTSSKKRATSPPGYMKLQWVSSSEIIDSGLDAGPPPSSVGLIVGIVVGAVVLVALLVVFFVCRQTDQTIRRLPKAVRRHYVQYTRNSRPWVLNGDPNGPHVFTKKLSTNGNGYRRMHALWMMMGGEEIGIEEAYAVHNPDLLHGFAVKHSNITAQNQANLFSSDWKSKPEVDGRREWTRSVYDKFASSFDWNSEIQVMIIPAIHGTAGTLARSIITTGFIALSKLDAGWYGKGVYFTTSAEYAMSYFATKAEPTVIISLVISGNAFPVIEHPKSPEKMMGAALVPGYHSHYVLTAVDGNPSPTVYPYDQKGIEFFDEIVIEQDACILPFYLLKISTKNIPQKAMAWQKKLEKMRSEKLEGKDDEIRDSRKGLNNQSRVGRMNTDAPQEEDKGDEVRNSGRGLQQSRDGRKRSNSAEEVF